MPPAAPPKRPPQSPPSSRAASTSVAGGTAATFGREGGTQKPKIVLYAVEGWGKTTCGAYSQNPAILMASNETGYLTLLQNGLAPDVDRAVSDTWPQTLATVDAMLADSQGHQTLVVDALTGFERQCQEFVCHTHFGGDWGEKGFASYGRGYDMAAGEWLKFLARLEQLRNRCNMTIVLLSHCKIKSFKNPEGPDYDRYTSNLHEKVWDATKQWASTVLFGNFLVATLETDAKKKSKAVGGVDRAIYPTRTAAYDAKNQFGLVDPIQLPDDPSQSWSTIWKALNERNVNGNS